MKFYTWHWLTSYKWISSKSGRARTNRVVINHLTTSIGATGSWTGVSAFLVDTGFFKVAF